MEYKDIGNGVYTFEIDRGPVMAINAEIVEVLDASKAVSKFIGDHPDLCITEVVQFGRGFRSEGRADIPCEQWMIVTEPRT